VKISPQLFSVGIKTVLAVQVKILLGCAKIVFELVLKYLKRSLSYYLHLSSKIGFISIQLTI